MSIIDTLTKTLFIILLINLAISIWVTVVVVQHIRRTSVQKKEAISFKAAVHLVVGICGMMLFLGMSGLLTFIPHLEAYSLVLNSFYGFLIFIYIFLTNNEAVECWKKLLSCRKCRFKLLCSSQTTTAASKKPKKISIDGTTPSQGKLTSHDQLLTTECTLASLTKENNSVDSTETLELGKALTKKSALTGSTAIADTHAVYTTELTSKVVIQNESPHDKENSKSRNSTKMLKNHMKEVEVDFHSE